MILLLGLLFILSEAPSLCLEQHGSFLFDGDFRHFAVANDTVYIATEEKLYQLNHDLTPVHSLTQKGVLKRGDDPDDPPGTEYFSRVSGAADWNSTFRINILLPFAENRSVISCGVTDNECGYCEILDLKNISNILHRENFQVGPKRSNGSVGFLVTLKNTPPRRDTFILTAIGRDGSGEGKCASDSQTVNLHNTDSNPNNGGIFSLNAESEKPAIKSKVNLEFVDGFQVDSIIYLLSNVPSGAKDNQVRLIWLEDKLKKQETLKSLRGATLRLFGGAEAGRLLASSVIPGGLPGLWSGVFSVDGGQSNTQLLLFDISPDLSGDPDNDPHFYFSKDSRGTSKMLRPEAVLLRRSYMTSVLAVRQRGWMVFFIGTGDGQLIKLAVDRKYHTACPRVLYRSNEDRRVFPRMHLDPVDHRHVYVPFQNEMKRVAVAQCSTYTTLQECWVAHDPHCVWCAGTTSCRFEGDCEDSDWLSIPDLYQQKMVSHKVLQDSTGELTLNIQTHVKMSKETLACQISPASGEPCRKGPPPQFPRCTCILSDRTFPPEGLRVAVKMKLGSTYLEQQLQLMNCSENSELPTPVWCQRCIKAGCGWSNNRCTWANEGVLNDSVCQTLQSELNSSKPEISSITPSMVSFYGRNHAVLSGRDLSAVTAVRMQPDLDCTTQESPVWNNTGTSLTFHIPSSKNKETVRACALLPDGSCHGDASITYRSSPSCRDVSPRNSWISGGRRITLTGSHLEFVEGVVHSHAPQEVQLPINHDYLKLTYESPAAPHLGKVSSSSVLLRVANETLRCSSTITYHPDPKFVSFTSSRSGDNVHIIIQKKADKLEMTTAELSVWGEQGGKRYPCIMEDKDESNETDFFNCEIQSPPNAKFQRLMIQYGDKTVPLEQSQNSLMLLVLLALVLLPCIIVAVVVVSRRQQKKLNAQMNRFMEDLELDIRNDIRQGFVDLQTERADLMENVGAIPFLDYKHFASRIFFPESESLMALCVRDIGQDVVKLDECCQGLSRLLQDRLFLTSMVHALEEQKSFTIKDKCALASLLTVALHGNLSYLTEVMEVLLKDLMQQSSNAQPKLLLRRTESTVEKLLTNWMSICLYGFLRESVGQHLFLMVSALSQQIAKGPVDCVTEKALYTLSEDWLLWQAPDFQTVKLRVLFAVGTGDEVSEPLEVEALSCDTVEQVKDKILATFKAKFGFPYNTAARDARIEFEKDGSFVPLEEVDSSSGVLGDVTMLNTMRHYKVDDGATVKVLSRKSHPPLSPQGSLKDDENFSGKYFHLIDPDVVEDQRKSPERKKLKVKEVHLTKLLSTKVAVHSYVENLFRAIWGTSQSKPPHAVRYFFGFLDAQADGMKISDPDVLHIWKTNSLPLRFWINILKNPQFVFDMEKSPHLDGCLSVIAQAFMDSFSLSETQLGKHAPTNKLLYAKDIPKFKQEVKAYYKQIRDPPHVTEAQFQDFLREESKKHENEFNEAAALRELYKFIQRYFAEIKEKLDQNGAPAELAEQLQHVRDSFTGLKSCSWN